jgi:hypothetical protein
MVAVGGICVAVAVGALVGALVGVLVGVGVRVGVVGLQSSRKPPPLVGVCVQVSACAMATVGSRARTIVSSATTIVRFIVRLV